MFPQENRYDLEAAMSQNDDRPGWIARHRAPREPKHHNQGIPLFDMIAVIIIAFLVVVSIIILLASLGEFSPTTRWSP